MRRRQLKPDGRQAQTSMSAMTAAILSDCWPLNMNNGHEHDENDEDQNHDDDLDDDDALH